MIASGLPSVHQAITSSSDGLLRQRPDGLGTSTPKVLQALGWAALLTDPADVRPLRKLTVLAHALASLASLAVTLSVVVLPYPRYKPRSATPKKHGHPCSSIDILVLARYRATVDTRQRRTGPLLSASPWGLCTQNPNDYISRFRPLHRHGRKANLPESSQLPHPASDIVASPVPALCPRTETPRRTTNSLPITREPYPTASPSTTLPVLLLSVLIGTFQQASKCAIPILRPRLRIPRSCHLIDKTLSGASRDSDLDPSLPRTLPLGPTTAPSERGSCWVSP
jgi:hypothetical protein